MTGCQSAGEKFRVCHCRIKGFSFILGHHDPAIKIMLSSKQRVIPIVLSLHAQIEFSVYVQDAGRFHSLDPFVLHILFQICRLSVDHINGPVSAVRQSLRRITHGSDLPDVRRTAFVISGTTVHAVVLCPGQRPHVSFPAVIPETVQQNLFYII